MTEICKLNSIMDFTRRNDVKVIASQPVVRNSCHIASINLDGRTTLRTGEFFAVSQVAQLCLDQPDLQIQPKDQESCKTQDSTVSPPQHRTLHGHQTFLCCIDII